MLQPMRSVPSKATTVMERVRLPFQEKSRWKCWPASDGSVPTALRLPRQNTHVHKEGLLLLQTTKTETMIWR